MKKTTIAILGVDGSGKSTAVELVGNHYASNWVVSYMGFRRYEDPRIEQLQKKHLFQLFFIVFQVELA